MATLVGTVAAGKVCNNTSQWFIYLTFSLGNFNVSYTLLGIVNVGNVRSCFFVSFEMIN